MKTYFKFLLIIGLTTLLAGCWDITEPQRMYYINAVGVDYQNDEYIVYLQVINFADVAKSIQPSATVAPAEVGRATGKTIEEAIYKLYRSSDQEIFWGICGLWSFRSKLWRMNTLFQSLIHSYAFAIQGIKSGYTVQKPSRRSTACHTYFKEFIILIKIK